MITTSELASLECGTMGLEGLPDFAPVLLPGLFSELFPLQDVGTA